MTQQDLTDASTTDIAIIGMAARVPGAADIARFWANLRDGVESMTRFSDAELEASGVDPAVLRDPAYVKAGYVLEDMEMFDAAFFGYSPKEAAIMDPQHRNFLECAWTALEHAGHRASDFPGSIGVFAGSGMNTYMMHNLLTNPRLVKGEGMFLLRHLGNDKDFLSTRVSYEMNLRGPSVSVQTACSTSLVALHLACQSLLNAECDMALTGGVTIRQPQRVGYLYKEGEVTSPDGHCRPFDEAAQGTVFGSGAAVVVLRRLADAIADGDHVHAVIKGSAINNDGSLKIGYLAPSVDGQAQAIAEALGVSGVPPESIDYIETHGTGTPVGDPIEIAALAQAFGETGGRRGFCALGSVKSNIGHLDTAAGVVGVIKTALALAHGEIPPSLHFAAPNPAIDFENSPFFVNATLREWPRRGGPRRAGVSSLGVGGTNAHVILEEAPAPLPATAGPARESQLIVVSAKSPAALDRATARLATHLRGCSDASLADAAWTLQVGREAFPNRRCVVARSGDDAAAALDGTDARRVMSAVAPDQRPSVAFMFAGGGAQYAGMGADLYRSEPVFRREVDRCLEILRPHLDVDLRALMYPAAADPSTSAALERPSLALPALFITQYALARLLMSWGIEPSAMIGHSMGEYTAAHLAGVFSLEDAIALVALRGRLFERVPPGGMLSVVMSPEQLRPLLGTGLSIAAVNAPELVVASGPLAELDALQANLEQREIECRRIHINVAAHSAMLAPILDDFGAFFRRIPMRAPSMPFLSNVTGTWITGAEATDPSYWVRHLRGTVRFADGVGALLAESQRVLLEVGPGRTLGTLARLHSAIGAGHTIVTSMRHPDDRSSDVDAVLAAVGQLWNAGVTPDWSALHGSPRRRVPLPTYPFERQPHFVAPGRPNVAIEEDPGSEPVKRADVGEWFHIPSWRREAVQTPRETLGGAVLLMRDERGIADAVARQFRANGRETITVTRGTAFERPVVDRFIIDPASPSDFDRLVAALTAEGRFPRQIVHCWTADFEHGARNGGDPIADAEVSAFYSLLHLAQAIGREEPTDALQLDIITTAAHSVGGEPVLDPLAALTVGPARVIPQEFSGIACRAIDLPRVAPESRAGASLLERLGVELSSAAADVTAAYRGSERWIQAFEPLRLDGARGASRLRRGGVYLLTGGLGGLALATAGALAREHAAKLVLVGRNALPPREEWRRWLDTHDHDESTSRRIGQVQALEAAGAEVLVLAADIVDARQLAAAVQCARDHFGVIHGVIHTAGVLDDELIEIKDAHSAGRVLGPKVRGTLNLHALLPPDELDLFVVFSSRSAVTGIAGQVDYTAANAFLDAFAHQRAALDGGRTLSLAWSVWDEIGMAAQLRAPGGEQKPAGHPLLDTVRSAGDGEEIFETSFALGDRWVLDEHRVRDGDALIPGTGYLELVRAALQHHAASEPLELRDVMFLAPFAVRPGERRRLRVRLRRRGSDATFVVLGEVRVDGRGAWQELVRGAAGRPETAAPARVSPSEVSARCTEREVTFTVRHREHLDVGPRWDCLRRLRYGAGEAIATLELPAGFEGDLPAYALHPAMMDVATGCAQSLIPGYDPATDFYVPAAYTSLRVHAPLTARLFSHVRYRGGESEDLATFDVTIFDEQGSILAEASEYMMMRLRDRQRLGASDVTSPSALSEEEAFGASASGAGAAPGERAGILPAEGIDAFLRLVDGWTPPHVVVSPQDLAPWIRHLRSSKRPAPRVVAPDVTPVEQALAAHPAVAQAAAVARAGHDGYRLVAYIVPVAGEHVTVSELRRHLAATLPPDRVPQHFLELDAFPTTAEGLIDRAALPDPFAPEDDHVAPRTPTERVIAEVWHELLGVDRVSVHDNFLDAGGHSLLAMRAITRIAKRTGVRITASSLNLQTLEQIAADIDGRASEQQRAAEVPAPVARAGLAQRFLSAMKQTMART